MSERINFTELAKGLGGDIEEMALPNGSTVRTPVWTKALSLKMLDWFRNYALSHDSAEFDGHADPWTMMAILDVLRDKRVTNFIGPFGKGLDMAPYAVGAEAKPGQPVTFRLETNGSTAHLTAVLAEDPNPFAMPLADIAAPAIPEGSDVFVSLEGRHYLFNFPLPLTYGEKCRAMYMQDGDGYTCCISHTPDVKPGDPGQL